MNEYCNCGAKLPDEARFCHKCGKPQFELEDEPEPSPAVETVAIVADPELALLAVAAAASQIPPGISLRNPNAVRTALIAAGITGLVAMVPLPQAIALLWNAIALAAGGFLAVYLYHRRTGDQLNARSGARLGYFVGLFCFLMMLVIFTVTMVMVTSDHSLRDILREAAPKGNPELVQDFDKILESPGAIGAIVILALSTYFFIITLLPTIGGALAAKVLDKD